MSAAFKKTCKKCGHGGEYIPKAPDYEVHCTKCSRRLWRPRGKQKAYIDAYNGSAIEACKAAGYSEKSRCNSSMANKNLHNPILQAAILGRNNGKAITEIHFDMPGVSGIGRYIDCQMYDICLDKAAKANLHNFDCSPCKKYKKIEKPERLTWPEMIGISRLLLAVFEGP